MFLDLIDNLRFIRHMDDFGEELVVGELNATFAIEDGEDLGIENETPK